MHSLDLVILAGGKGSRIKSLLKKDLNQWLFLIKNHFRIYNTKLQ